MARDQVRVLLTSNAEIFRRNNLVVYERGVSMPEVPGSIPGRKKIPSFAKMTENSYERDKYFADTPLTIEPSVIAPRPAVWQWFGVSRC